MNEDRLSSSRARPGENLATGIGGELVSHILQGWSEVGIGRTDYTDIVGAFDRISYKVYRERNIDALLLFLRSGPVGWIAKCARYDTSARFLPSRALSQVRSIGFGLLG